MVRKLVVFPNDPMSAYFNKGEMAERYFNPGNFFQEVHVISLAKDEVAEEKVRIMAGNAVLKIHKVGKPCLAGFISGAYSNKISKLISHIAPQVIRAYNSNLCGWLAAKAGKLLDVPVVISLHADPERDIRSHINFFKDPKRWLVWNISRKIFEPYSLASAKKVICVYKFLYDYTRMFKVPDERVQLIYNRIDMDRFNDGNRVFDGERKPLKILCVGQISREKNPKNIIRAIKGLDVALTVIGKGRQLNSLKALASQLAIEEKINFIETVTYGEIHRYYQDADIFASANTSGGVSKAVIEAMASGLSVVVNKPLWEDEPELIGDSALIVEDSEQGYSSAFKRLMGNSKLRKKISKEVRTKALTVNGKKMEGEEKRLYQAFFDIHETGVEINNIDHVVENAVSRL